MHLCISVVKLCAAEVADLVKYAETVAVNQLLCLFVRIEQIADRHEPAACMRVSCHRAKFFQAVSM